jgi:hypothetical protein
LNCLSAGLLSISFLDILLEFAEHTFSRSSNSLRANSALVSLRLTVLLLASMSPPLTCPAVRVRSLPPPFRTLELSPVPEPPLRGDLQRILEIVGDPFQVAAGRRAQQPHEQEESHHRRDEVGIGDLPRATMVRRQPPS